jgi:membrane protease YdiL (CAAX protease family)
MRRLGFWPAALLSTALFAALHTDQVRTVVGAVTLAASTAVVGLVNCVLVRRTGRLTPAIMVHGTVNLLAVVLGLALDAA